MKKPIIMMVVGVLIFGNGLLRLSENYKYLQSPDTIRLKEFDRGKEYSSMFHLSGAYMLYGQSIVQAEGIKFIPLKMDENTVLSGIYVPIIPVESTEGQMIDGLAKQFGDYSKIPAKQTDQIPISQNTVFIFDPSIRYGKDIPPGVGTAQITGTLLQEKRKADFAASFKEASRLDINQLSVIYKRDFSKVTGIYLPMGALILGLGLFIAGFVLNKKTRGF